MDIGYFFVYYTDINNDNMEMIYYKPGELVELKADLPYKPTMVVKDVKKSKMRTVQGLPTKGEPKSTLIGISCFWFTADYLYQEATFNTKDLIKIRD